MAASHHGNSLSPTFYLLVSLILFHPTLAQIITIGHLPPTTCVTAIVTALPTTCPTPIVCPDICALNVTTLTQACTCASPIPTSTRTASCGTCSGCPETTILAPCIKRTPTVSCPVVTQTTGPGCTLPPGCVIPGCIALSTVEIPCGCRGIETMRSCATACPGCETKWIGVKGGCT